MASYVTNIPLHVEPLLGADRAIGSDTDPNTDAVSELIDQAEGLLNGTLDAVEITQPVTSSIGIQQCRSWCLDYVLGHIRQAHAAGGGDGDNDDGIAFLERWDARLKDILRVPQLYDAMLNGGATSSSTRRFRSHVKDNSESQTVDDFTPTFTRSTDF